MVSRRYFLVGAAGALAAPMVIKESRAAADSRTVTLTGYGGTYQEVLVKAALDPFTEETGIKVKIVPVPELAKVKAQLLSGNIEWDLFDGAATALASGSKQGFWDKVDASIVDSKDMVIPPTSDTIPWEIYTAGIIWDPRKFGPGTHPTNFAEFFDLKKFPGRRALPNRADLVLEVALLADGASPKEIYPLDINRALKALDRAKSGIASWFSTTTQGVSLVQTGEVDFSFSFASRAKATNEPGGGVPLAFSFEQNVFSCETFAVLKRAPNRQNAMKLLGYILRPEVQVRLMEGYGGVPLSKKAMAMLSSGTRKWQPDLVNPKSLFIDSAYWADNFEAVSARFKEWILS